MKIIITGFIALFLMLFSFSFALAENDTSNASVNDTDVPVLISAPSADVPEINNISEREASGSTFWRQIGIWFTFNQEKKAEKELKLAELQLVRARIAERNNNTQAMGRALEAHQALIDRVKNRIARLDNSSANVTKLIGLERAIEVHELRIDRLNIMLNNSNLSEEQIANIQVRIDQAENNTQHLKEVTQNKRERIEQRQRTENKSRGSDEENENKSEIENETVIESNLSSEPGSVVGCPEGCICGDRGVILEC